MSDQSEAQTPSKRDPRPKEADGPVRGKPAGAEAFRADPSPAAAALALAVASAKRSTARPAEDLAESVRSAEAERSPPAGAASRTMRRHLVRLAALLLAMLGGWSGAQWLAPPAENDPRWGAAAAALHAGREDLTRLTGDVTALKLAFESLKESVDGSRTEASIGQTQVIERLQSADRVPQEVSARIQQIGTHLDRIESAAKEPSARFAALIERLDRIESAAKEPSARFAALIERLDRIERQTAPATAKPAAAGPETGTAGAAPSGLQEHTGSVEPKSRDVPVEGWVLHEVYDGVALIESRNRRLIEVGRGEIVPGVGRVEAIERRGKRWVVVTAKGVIGAVR